MTQPRNRVGLMIQPRNRDGLLTQPLRQSCPKSRWDYDGRSKSQVVMKTVRVKIIIMTGYNESLHLL